LIQSYGISHEAEAFLQSAALHRTPFPLLRQVIEHDHLTYAPLSETASPLDWLTLTPILAEKPADPSAPTGRGLDRGMMRLKTCLLFGIPLSVKGNVQGVLLVEESQGGNDLPPWYIRERRLEILTGISQQTALAIQNERLQRDVLERERLERELELARQIQQTFLPDALPQIEGWELAVRWRPARQVGGDFYDAFNLPDGKIGLVIADVADKGIPAALFMTLIRTLIRAAVQQVDSPAEVLMGVNDLLSPDMQGGMFVTVVYAVLDPASQRLTYTNAGHNLPVVLRQQGQRLELLQKCGIALGIFENIELEEHTLTIDPGDFVVFYTDGITEAFSPVQEMYGEERLYASICASQAQDAEAMSDRIDQGVVDFTGDEYPSDDLTLVVLQRRM
jgi:serine phosphatase RsbU (regulator of sigma subunit)